MSEYPEGGIKFKLSPDGRVCAVAIRTRHPEQEPLMKHAWLVSTVFDGAENRPSIDMADWFDLPPSMIETLTASALAMKDAPK